MLYIKLKEIQIQQKVLQLFIILFKFFYAVLQIVVDDNMIFRDILVGWPGSVHDARVLRNSSLSATAATKIPGNTHLLGDGGYPLKRFSSPSYNIL